MQTSQLTEADIRVFMMDKPELNTLINGVRFLPQDIERQQEMVVDRFNLLNPPTGIYYTPDTFPFKFLMLQGTTGHLLRSLSINESLNELNMQGEGVMVSDKNKGRVAQELGNQFWGEFLEQSQQVKVNQNIAQVYGVGYSAYHGLPG